MIDPTRLTKEQMEAYKLALYEDSKSTYSEHIQNLQKKQIREFVDGVGKSATKAEKQDFEQKLSSYLNYVIGAHDYYQKKGIEKTKNGLRFTTNQEVKDFFGWIENAANANVKLNNFRQQIKTKALNEVSAQTSDRSKVGDIVAKAGKDILEGGKTIIEDAKDLFQDKPLKKRGLIGRLKQAAAIGATMLTLGGIGSIKNSIENSQAESQREAEIHYVQQKHGWQVSIDENSPLWNTQNKTGIPKYRSTQQQNDHQKYLDLMSGYIRSLRGEGYVFSEKDDPANRLENVMNEINGKIDDLKNLSQQFGSKDTTKRLQIMAKVKAEMNKIAKKMNTQSTARGRVDMLSNALRNVNQQKPQTMEQYNAMEVQSFRD